MCPPQESSEPSFPPVVISEWSLVAVNDLGVNVWSFTESFAGGVRIERLA